jgi:hypothetical protein
VRGSQTTELRALAQGEVAAVCKEFQSAIDWSSQSTTLMIHPVTAYVSVHAGRPPYFSESVSSAPDAVLCAIGAVDAADENGVALLKGRLADVWTTGKSAGMSPKPDCELDVEIVPPKGPFSSKAGGEVRFTLIVAGQPEGKKAVVKCTCVSDALMSGNSAGRVVSVGVARGPKYAPPKFPIGDWKDGPAKEPPGGWGRG